MSPKHSAQIANTACVRGKVIEANACYQEARRGLRLSYPDLRLVSQMTPFDYSWWQGSAHQAQR